MASRRAYNDRFYFVEPISGNGTDLAAIDIPNFGNYFKKIFKYFWFFQNLKFDIPIFFLFFIAKRSLFFYIFFFQNGSSKKKIFYENFEFE